MWSVLTTGITGPNFNETMSSHGYVTFLQHCNASFITADPTHSFFSKTVQQLTE